MSNQPLTLDEFPTTDLATWKQTAVDSLKGVPIEKMTTRTHEGIVLQPLYDAESFAEVPPSAPQNLPTSWLFAQNITPSDPAEFQSMAATDISRGQDALSVEIHPLCREGMAPLPDITNESGLCLQTTSDVATAFKNIDLENTPLFLQAGSSALLLTGLFEAAGKKWCGGILADPIAEYARLGYLPIALDDAFTEMATVARWNTRQGHDRATIGVDASLWSEAGGSAVEELAFGLAAAVEYIRELTKLDIPAQASASQIQFTFALGANIFMEIAKLRAARLLWANVLEAFGIPPIAMKIHGRSSHFNKSCLDPYTNVLRATAEGFAGAIGGVDSMHIATFDETHRSSGDLARRVARNTHWILADECLLDKISDPAAGSWYVETLTTQLATKAWELFQEVEKAGGLIASLQSGVPQSKVQAVLQGKIKAAGTRRDSYIGVNMFPNTKETDLLSEDASSPRKSIQRIPATNPEASRLERSVEAITEAFAKGAPFAEVNISLSRSVAADPEIQKVTPFRIAEPFEKLRKAALCVKGQPNEIKIWLANFGPAKQHKLRADFVSGFLSVGGFEINQGSGAKSIDEAVSAATASKAPIVVICSTDDTYPEIVPTFTEAIKAALPGVLVLLAGYPPEHVEAFKAAGIDDFIHIRLDCLSFAQSLQKRFGYPTVS